MTRLTLEDSDRVLVVEGFSDLRFFAELREHLQIDAFYIHKCNGKDDALAQIEVLITDQLLAEKVAFGVILDADEDPAARRRQLSSLLGRVSGAKLGNDGGWAPSRSKARVGYFVVPGDNQDATGEVESLVWRAWSSDEKNAPARACIDTFLRCMVAVEHQPKSIDKARIGALLSVRNEDDPRLGPGAQKRVFDFDRPEFAAVRAFLEGFRLPAS